MTSFSSTEVDRACVYRSDEAFKLGCGVFDFPVLGAQVGLGVAEGG